MITYTREEKQAIMEEYKTSGKSLKGYTEKSKRSKRNRIDKTYKM